MKRNSLGLTAVSVAILLAVPPTASAQKVTEEHLQELIRTAAARAGVSQIGGTPVAAPGGNRSQTGDQAGAPGGPSTVPMTLDEAIKLALDRNLDIAVQRLNPETFD